MTRRQTIRALGLAVSIALFCIWAEASAGASQCGSLKGELFRLGIQPDQDIRLNKPAHLIVRICNLQNEPVSATLRFDATMPAHNHGMNYRASVTRQNDGSLRINGIVLHMPGHWRFDYRVTVNGQTETLSQDLSVK